MDTLELLEYIRTNKDIDAVAELMYNVASVAGLTLMEMAAVNHYTFERMMKADHNRSFLKERLGIDTHELGAQGVIDIQTILTLEYAREAKKNE